MNLLPFAFAAEYAKLPLIPPFLQPSADFTSGANFASGGGGVLPETNQGLVRNSGFYFCNGSGKKTQIFLLFL